MCVCCLFLVVATLLWAVSWWSALVFPTTVEQAARWRPRTAVAATSLSSAPLTARSVTLVISRFSGNLSWVADVVALLGVESVVVYCKARCLWRLGAAY